MDIRTWKTYFRSIYLTICQNVCKYNVCRKQCFHSKIYFLSKYLKEELWGMWFKKVQLRTVKRWVIWGAHWITIHERFHEWTNTADSGPSEEMRHMCKRGTANRDIIPQRGSSQRRTQSDRREGNKTNRHLGCYLLVTGGLQQMVLHFQLFFHDRPHLYVHLEEAEIP